MVKQVGRSKARARAGGRQGVDGKGGKAGGRRRGARIPSARKPHGKWYLDKASLKAAEHAHAPCTRHAHKAQGRAERQDKTLSTRPCFDQHRPTSSPPATTDTPTYLPPHHHGQHHHSTSTITITSATTSASRRVLSGRARHGLHGVQHGILPRGRVDGVGGVRDVSVGEAYA